MYYVGTYSKTPALFVAHYKFQLTDSQLIDLLYQCREYKLNHEFPVDKILSYEWVMFHSWFSVCRDIFSKVS